jgi:Flp pilus assembly protein TadD/uncharacterized protein (AIM24 family)
MDPTGDEPIETESRRLTPSIGLAHESDHPTDSSNEDFLFHLYRGSELLQDNRVHEAKEELERALHLQPRDSKGQDLLAVVYFRLGLYPRAIQIYEQLRRRNTNDTALLLNLALCYLKTGQPKLARRDLEHLLSLNPSHSRAWGYLGLACERMNDLAAAEGAFVQGGHSQMAKRIAARREAGAPPQSDPNKEIREVAGAAYQDLDAGELSFALAESTSDRDVERQAASSWRPHELGQVRPNEAPPAPPSSAAAVPPPPPTPERGDTRKPDTKDGPPIAAPHQAPQPAVAHPGPNRRPTLIAPVGAPPAPDLLAASEYADVRIPSHQPPSLRLDDTAALPPSLAIPSLRRPVVAVPSPFGPPKSHDAFPPMNPGTRTLPPPLVAHGSAPPREELEPPIPAKAESLLPFSAAAPASARIPSVHPPPSIPSARPPPSVPRTSSLKFPPTGVTLHPSGVALVHTTAEVVFAARLEAIRAQQSGLKMQLLERHMKGKSTGEQFGGIASPMVLASGEGELVLSARAGRKLSAFTIAEGEMCFAREDVLLGFGGRLSFENGRLSTGEGSFLAVVQLRGDGAVLLETIGEVLALDVRADRSLSVRREVLLGWFGRLVPRALSPSEAPCGQRGLVSFAGEGRVVLASV